MRLYSGTIQNLIDDSVHNRIADKLRDAFFASFRYQPSPSEQKSWRDSLRAVSQVFDEANLTDHGVLLEYQLPMTSKRLDCMVLGRDEMLRDQAIIVELKQWEQCTESDGDRIVTFVGGAHRDVLHPSVQVGQYRQYLQDFHTAFHQDADPVGLRACAYLHNYTFTTGDPILAPKFQSCMAGSPLYSADDVDALVEMLRTSLTRGDGLHVLSRVERSKFRPSKKLLEHVGRIIEGKPEYTLLDEQLVAFDRVLAAARDGYKDKRKTVVLVRGGPGTGKSVIALNLMAALSRLGFNADYATGSKAFTTTLQQIVGSRAGAKVRFFRSYAEVDFNAVDVLICDEAHRLRRTNNIQYTPQEKRSDTPQIETILNAAKVAVFFIDDNQNVTQEEIGSSSYVLDKASEKNCRVFDYRLEAQFRCAGSEAFVNWVNNTLEIERTANVLWDFNEAFDFKVVDSPVALEAAVKAKLVDGGTGRLAAGYCWSWSKPRSDGTLETDVVLDGFAKPWNARPDAGRLARGIPKAPLWAYDSNGFAQVGCVYTAQGFEFDYIGVIFGNDLVYRHGTGWVALKENSKDPTVRRAKEKFIDLVKNTYRVLLTRGMKGCYVYFMDKETRDFVLSRTERTKG